MVFGILLILASRLLLWAFYKGEDKKLLLLIGALQSGFLFCSIGTFLTLFPGTGNPYVFLFIVVLLDAVGYYLLIQPNWRTALLAAAACNIAVVIAAGILRSLSINI